MPAHRIDNNFELVKAIEQERRQKNVALQALELVEGGRETLEQENAALRIMLLIRSNPEY